MRGLSKKEQDLLEQPKGPQKEANVQAEIGQAGSAEGQASSGGLGTAGAGGGKRGRDDSPLLP